MRISSKTYALWLMGLLCLICHSSMMANQHVLRVFVNPKYSRLYYKPSDGYLQEADKDYDEDYFKFEVEQGDSIYLEVYCGRESYRFSGWKSEGRTWDQPEITFVMGDHDVDLTADFVFDPANIGSPVSNYFDVQTGTLYMDDFAPGTLSRSIGKNVEYDYYENVKTIKVYGEIKDEDLSISDSYTLSRYFSELETVDFSNTVGATTVPEGSLYGIDKLDSFILPASIDSIDGRAFYACPSLQTITLNSVIPPKTTERPFDSFYGISEDVKFYVPSEVLSIYMSDPNWSKRQILPNDANTGNLIIMFPDDWTESMVKGCVIEIESKYTGQSFRVMADKLENKIFNIDNSKEYLIRITTLSGTILGEIELPSIAVGDNVIHLTDLKKPSSLVAKVYDEKGTDVTDGVNLVWYDGEKILGRSSSISNLVVGMNVRGVIGLNKTLGKNYSVPEEIDYTISHALVDSISIVLSPLVKKELTLKVIDQDTNRPIYDATISLSQSTEGNDVRSEVAHTDRDGCLSIIALDGKDGSIEVSASGYKTKTCSLASLMDGEIALSRIRGSRLYISSEWVSAEYPDSVMNNLFDVAYRLSGDNLPEYSVGSSEIDFYEYLQPGYKFSVTAYSPEGKFEDIVEDVIVEENGKAYVSFQFIENGGADLIVDSDNSIGMILLYDSLGNSVDTSVINDGVAGFRNLKSGQYSAVIIERNRLYNSFSSLEALKSSPLLEGTDYNMISFSVTKGKITQQRAGTLLHISSVLDNMLADGSYVTTDKTLYGVGDYVTIKAKYVIEEEFEDYAENSQLLFYLPENCELIENTVCSDQGIKGYYMNGRVLNVNAVSNEFIKFCVRPRKEGTYDISAQVSLDGNMGDKVETIPAARFIVPLLSLEVPAFTDCDVISTIGIGPKNGKVLVYDGNQLVGSTQCDGNGEWRAEISLAKPFPYSIHEITAQIEDAEGLVHTSEKKIVVHDTEIPRLQSVDLIYYSQTVKFDFVNQTVSPKCYTYRGQAYKYDYTFIGNWSKGDDKTIRDAKFVVTCQNGDVFRIPAQWDTEKYAFIASRKFTYDGTFIVPVFVTMEATVDRQESIPDITKQLEDYNYKMEVALEDLKQSMIISNIKQDVTDNKVSFDYQAYEGSDISNFEVSTISSASLEDAYPDAPCWGESETKIVFDVSENGKSLDMYIWNPAEQEGTLVSLSQKNDKMNTQKKIAVNPGTALIFSLIKNVVPNTVVLPNEGDNFSAIVEAERKNLDERTARINELIYSKDACGRYKISDPLVRARLKTEAEVNKSVKSELIDDLNSIIGDRKYINFVNTYVKVIYEAFNLPKDYFENYFEKGDKIINDLRSVIQDSDVGGMLDFLDDSFIREAYWKESNENTNEYISLMKKIYDSLDSDCDGPIPPDDKDDKKRHNSVKALLDPSGYVYEGEPENRVENVKATVYYQENGVEKVWDAENYGQENPLYTDKDGRYEWYVPDGLWQVKFEKEGYKNTQSEWLPVPPPQMDVNVEILSMAAPLVSDANAYTERVIVGFDRYVDSDAVVEDEEAFITVDGRKISGQWEAESEGDYSRSFIFYPEKRIGSDTVVLNVNGTLRSKAGVMVGADFTRELKVEEEITSIDLSEIIRIPYGEAVHIEVLFEPAATANGKCMHVEVESEEILKPFVKDVLIENGKAVISLYGNLPGASNLMISVNGSYTKAESEVVVLGMTYDHTPMPTSSLPDMSVITPETDIKLFCADKTAAIRYTVDGTDPLSSATAVDYVRNEAIRLSQNTVLKAVAISEEKGASETAIFNYIISTFAVDEIKATDSPIQYIDGTVYCDGAKRIAVFNLEGRKVVEKAATEVSLNKLSRGIYIAAAYTDNGLSILKIKK